MIVYPCVCVYVCQGLIWGGGGTQAPPGFAITPPPPPPGVYLFDIQCCWYKYIVMGDKHYCMYFAKCATRFNLKVPNSPGGMPPDPQAREHGFAHCINLYI